MIGSLAILAVADMLLVGLYATGNLATTVMMPAHLMMTLIALHIWWVSGRKRRFAPVVGCAFGPLAVLITIALPPVRPMRISVDAQDDDPLDSMLQPVRAPAQKGARLTIARLLDGRIEHPSPARLGSLVTMLRHGSVENRRKALETVVRGFEPALSPLVAQALTDSDQTIRALGAAAAARITQNVAERRAALQSALDNGDMEAMDELRSLLLDHAQQNVLLSDTQREHMYQSAMALLPLAATADQPANDIGYDDAQPWRALELLWSRQDLNAIDHLCGMAVDDAWRGPRAMRQAARWWREAAQA